MWHLLWTIPDAFMQEMDAEMMGLVEDSVTAPPLSPVSPQPHELFDASRLEQRERRVKKKEEQVHFYHFWKLFAVRCHQVISFR